MLNLRLALLTMGLLGTLAVLPQSAWAGDTAIFIRQARQLMATAQPGKFDTLFQMTQLRELKTAHPPLARYRPADGDTRRGFVEFGSDLRRYQDEYVYVSSIIPKVDRPDFNQYMTVLTALNLGNEYAHFIQHQNGSLDDFFEFKQDNKINQTCALYSLQQHVSDITMLDLAVRLEEYFQRIQSVTGQNAVTSSLERMDLLRFYTDFKTIAAAQDRARMNDLLHRLKTARDRINTENLRPCRKAAGSASLPRAVIARAIAPAWPYLLSDAPVATPSGQSRTGSFYNN